MVNKCNNKTICSKIILYRPLILTDELPVLKDKGKEEVFDLQF